MDELSDMLHFEIDSGCDLTGHELSIKGKTVEMEFSQMEPFPEHKFRLYEGQQLTDMVDSIRQFGILLPIILVSAFPLAGDTPFPSFYKRHYFGIIPERYPSQYSLPDSLMGNPPCGFLSRPSLIPSLWPSNWKQY
jgi:hypothetical protein